MTITVEDPLLGTDDGQGASLSANAAASGTDDAAQGEGGAAQGGGSIPEHLVAAFAWASQSKFRVPAVGVHPWYIPKCKCIVRN